MTGVKKRGMSFCKPSTRGDFAMLPWSTGDNTYIFFPIQTPFQGMYNE
jgi:hypothetical protein